MNQIILGGITYTIAPLQFGKVREITAEVTEMGGGIPGSMQFTGHGVRICALLTGKTPEEINELFFSIPEMNAAVEVALRITGLKAVAAGEAAAVQTGTTSTAI